MNRTIKASLNYEIDLSETNYEIRFDRTAENELSAAMIARELLKYNKENLIKSLTQAKGPHLKMVRDRLQKVTTTEDTLRLLIESIISEFLIEDEVKKEVGV